jgi:O-antigen/teichoic acid export membrane protein
LFDKASPTRLARGFALQLRSLRMRERGAPRGGNRGSQRYRRAAFGGAATLLGNGVRMLGSLAAMPLALHFLGPERFGLWATLTSLMTLASIGDLGIGNGLINALSAAHGNDDRSAAGIYVSSVFFMTLLLSAGLLVLLLVVVAGVRWASLFHLSSPRAIAEAGPAVTALALCIVLNVPLGVLTKIRVAYQEIHINGLWQTLGVVLGLGALVLCIRQGMSLPWLIAADAGGQAVAMIGNLGRLFLVDRPWLRPTLRCVDIGAARALLKLGVLFFALAVLGVIAFYSDNLLAIWVCGPEAAGVFAISVKLFSPCRLVAATLLQPLWPAYGEAIARGDVAWVRRTVTLSTLGSVLVAAPPALALLLFGDALASLWMRQPISLGLGLLSGMALWAIIETIGAGIGYFLNGASLIRVQLILGTIFAVVAVAAKVTLAKEFGIAGIAWGTLFAYAGVMLLPYIRIVRRHLQDLARRFAASPSHYRDEYWPS